MTTEVRLPPLSSPSQPAGPAPPPHLWARPRTSSPAPSPGQASLSVHSTQGQARDWQVSGLKQKTKLSNPGCHPTTPGCSFDHPSHILPASLTRAFPFFSGMWFGGQMDNSRKGLDLGTRDTLCSVAGLSCPWWVVRRTLSPHCIIATKTVSRHFTCPLGGKTTPS